MKKSFARPIRFVALALALVAGAASAQSVVNGPYYATPSWDQTLPASSRFLVLSNFNGNAVLDRETGLVWQRAIQPPLPFYSAFAGCFSAKTGGRMGWRLPTIAEVTSLFDPSVMPAPSLPVGHPFTDYAGLPKFSAKDYSLWSSSLNPANEQYGPSHFTLYNASSVSGFGTTLATSAEFDTASVQYLCVRSPG